jgi:hypothetical protein
MKYGEGEESQDQFVEGHSSVRLANCETGRKRNVMGKDVHGGDPS